jgi:hypothetical protein
VTRTASDGIRKSNKSSARGLSNFLSRNVSVAEYSGWARMEITLGVSATLLLLNPPYSASKTFPLSRWIQRALINLHLRESTQ